MTCDCCAARAVRSIYAGYCEGIQWASFFVRVCLSCDPAEAVKVVRMRGWVRH